jgi:hypothetical protein
MLLLEFIEVLNRHGYDAGRKEHALLVAKWIGERSFLRDTMEHIGTDLFFGKLHIRRYRRKYETIMRWKQGKLAFVNKVLACVGE